LENQIPAEGVPLTCCALSDILHPLLAQLEGLALMCYHGARQPDAMLEEVIPAVGLLAELLRVVRSLHTRWEHDNPQLGAP
jgi:hypothetical protein